MLKIVHTFTLLIEVIENTRFFGSEAFSYHFPPITPKGVRIDRLQRGNSLYKR